MVFQGPNCSTSILSGSVVVLGISSVPKPAAATTLCSKLLNPGPRETITTHFIPDSLSSSRTAKVFGLIPSYSPPSLGIWFNTQRCCEHWSSAAKRFFAKSVAPRWSGGSRTWQRPRWRGNPAGAARDGLEGQEARPPMSQDHVLEVAGCIWMHWMVLVPTLGLQSNLRRYDWTLLAPTPVPTNIIDNAFSQIPIGCGVPPGAIVPLGPKRAPSGRGIGTHQTRPGRDPAPLGNCYPCWFGRSM